MNERRKRFVLEYVKDLNATKAAERAGYSSKTATKQGSRLLTFVDVREAIEKHNARYLERLNLTTERILSELSLMGFANMLDYIAVQDGDAYIDLSKLSREQAAAIQEITVVEYTKGKGEDKRDIKKTRFKLAEKRGSLELLGKHLKLFTDKIEHSGDVNPLNDILNEFREANRIAKEQHEREQNPLASAG